MGQHLEPIRLPPPAAFVLDLAHEAVLVAVTLLTLDLLDPLERKVVVEAALAQPFRIELRQALADRRQVLVPGGPSGIRPSSTFTRQGIKSSKASIFAYRAVASYMDYMHNQSF